MTEPADAGSKRLISLDPTGKDSWVTGIPKLMARDILTSVFQWVGWEGGVLIRASEPNIGEFLMVNEL